MSDERKKSKVTKAASEIKECRRWYYDRITHAKDYGEHVANTMICVQEEVLRSFDVWTSFAENYGPLCAAKHVSDYYCELAEADGFSRDLCSYLRIGAGYLKRAKEIGSPPPEAPVGGMGQIDMIVAPSNFCDGRWQWPLASSRYLDVPLFIYDQQDLGWWQDSPESRKYYIEYTYGRLKELVAFLEKATGKRFDEAKLSEALELWMKAHRLFHDATELRTHHPNPLTSVDSFAVCFPNIQYKGTKECVDYYQRLYDEIKFMVDRGIGAVPNEKFRVFWFGLPPWHYFGAFDYLQSHGFSVIDTIYDAGDVPDDVDLNNPLYAIAKKFYDGRWFLNGLVRRRNFEDYIRWVCTHYDIDGIITLIGTSCRVGALQVYRRQVINTKLGLPVLNLDIDMTDVRSFSEAEVRSKLDSFMEAVEVSKKKGDRST